MYVADLVRAGDCYQTESFKISHTFEVFCCVDLSLWESGICAYMVQKVAQKIMSMVCPWKMMTGIHLSFTK